MWFLITEQNKNSQKKETNKNLRVLKSVTITEKKNKRLSFSISYSTRSREGKSQWPEVNATLIQEATMYEIIFNSICNLFFFRHSYMRPPWELILNAQLLFRCLTLDSRERVNKLKRVRRKDCYQHIVSWNIIALVKVEDKFFVYSTDRSTLWEWMRSL